jgi:hypothetical protein
VVAVEVLVYLVVEFKLEIQVAQVVEVQATIEQVVLVVVVQPVKVMLEELELVLVQPRAVLIKI